MRRILPVVPLTLPIAALFVAGAGLAGELPRAPQEGLSYLERAFLPESVPAEDAFSGVAPPGESTLVEPNPDAFLSGTSFSWTSMSPPDGRSNHTAVYDPVQDRVLVFGGRRLDQSLGLFNDTWELQLAPAPKWKFLGASGTLPEARAGHVAVIDPLGNRMLVWGGDDDNLSTPLFNEVWALSLTSSPTWSKLNPTGTPPAGRFAARAIYDPTGRRLLFFGGLLADNTCSSEVWELHLSPTLAWNRLTPSNPGPSGRYWHSVTFDEARNRLLIYGGSNVASILSDVWILQLSDPPTWEQLAPAEVPPEPRYTHVAAFDAPQDRMVITSGVSSTSYLNDSWALEFSPAPRWVRLDPGNETLLPRTSPAGTHLPGRNSLLLFGGYLNPGWPDMYINDTWELLLFPGDERWEIAVDGNEPDPFWLGRWGHSAVLDTEQNQMIAFGGYSTGGERYDTWAISLAELDSPPHWTEIITQGTTHPSARQGHTAIFDSVGRRMIVFGGGRGGVSAPYADCWQLDLGSNPPVWARFTFSGATPPARWQQAAVFDPSRRRMVVFGGDTKTRFLNDLWVLDLNGTPTWTQLTPVGTLPGTRAMHSLVLDEKEDRILLFGGDAPSGQDYNDLWALSLADPSHWDLLAAGGSSPSIPTSRFYHVASYDSLNDRMLLYGGCGLVESGLWIYSDHSSTPGWTYLKVPNAPPLDRCGRTAVCDPGRGAWILYGGAAGAASNTLWNFRWDVPVPVQITYASVHRDGDGVVLEWRASEANQGAFYVDRELPGQTRERISAVVPSTSTGYSFRDSSDPPAGTRYYLELLDRAGGTTTFGPYELLEGHGVLGLTPMLTATPNPFRTGVKLTARSLPPGDLSIEVCSVAGRIVRREPPITGFAGGHAEFQIPGLEALPAGMYFVRVRVGAEVVSSRLVKLQ